MDARVANGPDTVHTTRRIPPGGNERSLAPPAARCPKAEVHAHLEGCFESALLEQWVKQAGESSGPEGARDAIELLGASLVGEYALCAPGATIRRMRTLLLYTATALAEIVGCCLPWLWLRQAAPARDMGIMAFQPR